MLAERPACYARTLEADRARVDFSNCGLASFARIRQAQRVLTLKRAARHAQYSRRAT